MDKRDMTATQKAEVVAAVKEIGGEGSRTLEFVASTETADRSRDIIDVAGWKLDNYVGGIGKGANPIFAWSHNYEHLPVGKTVGVVKDVREKKLRIQVRFPTIAELCSDPSHPSDAALFSDTVYNMYKGGMLNAVSVGFRGLKFKTRDDDEVMDLPDWQRGVHFLEQELLEVSAVLVPCNPEALVSMRGMKSFDPRGIDMVESAILKGAIPHHKYPLADEAAKWNASAVVSAATTDDLKVMCAWYDEDDADVKSSYKLPHHMGKDDGFKTVWAGVRAAMGVLFGARGGVNIVDADKVKCYNHLKKHYDEFGKEAPEWGKAYSPEELKCFFGMEVNDVEILELEKRIAELEAKSGSRFSKQSREDIQQVVDAIAACEKGLKACHEKLAKMIEQPPVDEQPDDEGDEGKSFDLSKATISDVAKNLFGGK